MTPAVLRLASLYGDAPEIARLRNDAIHLRVINAATAHAATPPKVVLVIAGTRPECIKLAPVLRALAHHPDLTTLLASARPAT